MGTAINHPMTDQDMGTMMLSPERQSAQMSKIAKTA